MPRPKRTRAVASRKATEEPTASESPAQPVQASAPPSSDIYDLSDREKERLARRKSGIDVDAEQMEGQARQPPPLVVDAISQDATVGASTGDVESPPELGRRSETSARRARHTDVSGLELDDSMFGDLDDSLVGAEESQSGQRSNETSSLNVAAFRRRPRVSSIVGKDDAPIRPSSRGPNTPGITSTFSFGNFKRRKREPSILGTARRHRSTSRQPGVSEDESAGEEDFTRLGDPTPARRAVSRSSAVPTRAGSRDLSPQRQARKRKSLEDQGGGGKRVAAESDTDLHNSIEVDDDDEPLSSPPTTPARATTPDPNDPDLAPPASIASSEDSPVIRANLDNFSHRNYHARRSVSRARKTPELDGDASDISSPPSLTHSPNYSAPTRKAAPRGRARKRDPSPKVTTADLASLLPRRRHKHVEISSDAEEDTLTLDNDDDELSYAQPRGRSTRRTRPLGNVSNVAAKGKQPAKGKGAKRTYGSRVSDKENEEDSIVVGGSEDEAAEEEEEVAPDAETSQMMLERLGEELKNAAQKFKEVDRWELEFEEVTEPSSPGAAR
ncbi:hypothetical protein CONLIGDRAFT_202081 [Coniochaeta ligniaria NRRL 30616]|uniref:Uncharacterized protein n=1 Tax=Coniochaeta ligniaria NRRL 30616 TaxID=1408157 RepID=A0A1J7J1M5_9PEZI|nr:hypothetical protein CONLIGDRAFT_202081 [Coniochaeta ligniaria NRRL 30616]